MNGFENSIKNILKKIIKNNIFLTKLNNIRMKKKSKETNDLFVSMDRKETFEYIYRNNMWGGEREEFYSGEGSHNKLFIESYCSFIKCFIREHKIKSVCDLGCGDFNVTSQWIENDYNYIGVDIVSQIVMCHNQKYASSKRKFCCLDIVEDELPLAELCVIRQVFQHLSNEEIKKVLKKTEQYKYVLVTEHITRKEYAEFLNADKIHGSHTRTNIKSGVYLDEYPFNQKVTVMLSIPYKSSARLNEELITVLICH